MKRKEGDGTSGRHMRKREERDQCVQSEEGCVRITGFLDHPLLHRIAAGGSVPTAQASDGFHPVVDVVDEGTSATAPGKFGLAPVLIKCME